MTPTNPPCETRARCVYTRSPDACDASQGHDVPCESRGFSDRVLDVAILLFGMILFIAMLKLFADMVIFMLDG